jgi:hypothetical protein
MTDDPSDNRPSPKVWTAIQHGSGLVAGLGVFVAISAFSTDPDSGIVLIGVIMAFVGLIGVIIGRTAGRRYHDKNKNQ